MLNLNVRPSLASLGVRCAHQRVVSVRAEEVPRRAPIEDRRQSAEGASSRDVDQAANKKRATAKKPAAAPSSSGPTKKGAPRQPAADSAAPEGSPAPRAPRGDSRPSRKDRPANSGRPAPVVSVEDPEGAWAQIKKDAPEKEAVDLGRTVELMRALVKTQRSKAPRKLVAEMALTVAVHPNADAHSLVSAIWCLAESNHPEARRLVPKLYSPLRFFANEMTEGGVSTLLFAMGTLESALPQEIMDACMARLEKGFAPTVTTVTITSVLFGLSRLKDVKNFKRAEVALRPLLIRKLFKGDVRMHLTTSLFKSFANTRVRMDDQLLDGVFFSLKTHTPKEGLEVSTVVAVMHSLTAMGVRDRFWEFLAHQTERLIKMAEAGQVHPAQAASVLSNMGAQAFENNRKHAVLVNALVSCVVRAPSELRATKYLTYILWALAKLDMGEEFDRAEEALRPVILEHLESGELVSHNVGALVYGYGRLHRYMSPELVAVLTEYVRENVGSFSELSASTMLWGLSRLRATEVFVRMEELLQPVIVENIRKKEFNVRGLDNCVHAYADVGLTPPEGLMALFDQHFDRSEESTLEDMRYAVTWFYGKAILAQVPTAKQLSQLTALTKKFGRELPLRQLCMLSWDLGAILCVGPGVALNPEFWEAWSTVLELLPAEKPAPSERFSMKPSHQAQIYHSYLMLQAGTPKGRGPKKALKMPEWLVEEGRAAWETALRANKTGGPAVEEGGRVPRVYEVRESIARMLKAMGAAPEMDILTEDGLIRVGLALRSPAHKVSISVDGHLDYCKRTGRRLGPIYIRDRLLEARGYEVISVPTTDWDSLKYANKQMRYLKSRLQHCETALGVNLNDQVIMQV